MSITRKLSSSFTGIWLQLRLKRGNNNSLYLSTKFNVSRHYLHYRNLMIWGYILHPKRLPEMLLQGQIILHCVIRWKASNSSVKLVLSLILSFPLWNFWLALCAFFHLYLSVPKSKPALVCGALKPRAIFLMA